MLSYLGHWIIFIYKFQNKWLPDNYDRILGSLFYLLIYYGIFGSYIWHSMLALLMLIPNF